LHGTPSQNGAAFFHSLFFGFFFCRCCSLGCPFSPFSKNHMNDLPCWSPRPPVELFEKKTLVLNLRAPFSGYFLPFCWTTPPQFSPVIVDPFVPLTRSPHGLSFSSVFFFLLRYCFWVFCCPRRQPPSRPCTFFFFNRLYPSF